MSSKENNQIFGQYVSSLINESRNMSAEVDHLMVELKNLKETGQKEELLKKIQEIETTNPTLFDALKQTLIGTTNFK